MNRYKITFNGYNLPTEILADDFYIEPDTSNAIFHNNGCDMKKVATFKEYTNIILVQEDEKQLQIEKLRKDLKGYKFKVNKEITIYKYVILTLILSFTILYLLK